MAVLFIVLIGCASTRTVVEPPVDTASPPSVVDPALGLPTGPPPGHVEPTNYWVREKIVLTSETEPPKPTTPKGAAKKSKKSKKTG
jgi:hypothetical protein